MHDAFSGFGDWALPERPPVARIARDAGVSRPAVWRWQRRFAESGVEGLLRQKTSLPGKSPLPDANVERVVE